MAQVLADRRDIDFVIWEQMNGEEIINKKKYEGFDRKTCDMIITEARKLAIKEILPTLTDSDRQGVSFDKGEV